MTDLTFRRVREDEYDAFFTFVNRAFFEIETTDELARWREVVDVDRMLAVTDDTGAYVASSGTFALSLSMPRAEPVACAGVTVVSVRADHRRRGVMRSMMDRLLADAREHGEPMAALYASEGAIYGRFGFGPAVPVRHFEIDHHRAAPVVRGDPTAVRLVDVATLYGHAPTVHEAWRRQRGGIMRRTPPWWRHWLDHDTEQDREGGWSHRYHAVTDGGYAVYRGTSDWSDRHSLSRLRVEELVALDASTYRDLWTFLTSIDLVETIELRHRPPDDPLPFLVADEARVRDRAGMPLWVRPVDLPAALEARGYRRPGAIVMAVGDPTLPDNAGKWRLEVDVDGASCRRTDAFADVELDVADLSTVMLGGVRATTLRDAGRVVEHRGGAAADLDTLMSVAAAPATSFDF